MSDGASYKEQLLESARRNNTELFQQIATELGNSHAKLSALINDTREIISGNTPLHIATSNGNWEFVDLVLDIEGVEIDPQNREGETPLHLAVKFGVDDPDFGYFVVDNLIDAGSDVRIIDKYGLKPVNYVVNNEKLRTLLESAEYANGAVILAGNAEDIEEEDDDDEGSASDSDNE